MTPEPNMISRQDLSNPAEKGEYILQQLAQRLCPVHARQRLEMEGEYEYKFNERINFLHPERWYSVPSILTHALKLLGIYQVGTQNAEQIQLRRNVIELRNLPKQFHGFTILHLSDLHTDINPRVMRKAKEIVAGLKYDVCVLTGDFRGRVYGPFDATLSEMENLRSQLGERVYGVLGNYDSVRMVAGLEMMGIRILLNESEPIVRGTERIHLAGVDDAHYYRAADIGKATARIPDNELSILLSHTPEIYRQAARAGFKVFLSGHTHGGQVCLPGSIPLTLSSHLPRRLGAGPWTYHGMAGYTSVGVGSSIVGVRFNCPPEITLHYLHSVIEASHSERGDHDQIACPTPQQTSR